MLFIIYPFCVLCCASTCSRHHYPHGCPVPPLISKMTMVYNEMGKKNFQVPVGRDVNVNHSKSARVRRKRRARRERGAKGRMASRVALRVAKLGRLARVRGMQEMLRLKHFRQGGK